MWFSAKLIFKSSVDDGTDLPSLCEESIRLIEANNEKEALEKSNQLGASEAHEYKNDLGNTVKWRFVKVTEIQDLCEQSIYDGMEVYSKLLYSDTEPRKTKVEDPLNPG